MSHDFRQTPEQEAAELYEIAKQANRDDLLARVAVLAVRSAHYRDRVITELQRLAVEENRTDRLVLILDAVQCVMVRAAAALDPDA